MAAAFDANARTKLQEEVGTLAGVEHVSLDPSSGTLWIVRHPGYEQGPVEIAVRNHIASLGHDPAEIDVRLTAPVSSGPRRRVRFESVERVEEHGRVTIEVALEWHDTVHTGSAAGEEGPAIELKTTARAAVIALERLTGQNLDLRIIGVKPIRAFDSDLMVASVIRGGAGQKPLVGAVVVSSGPLEAAALAVLSALNRILGNTLHTSD
jgi:hypothetical protein